MGIFETYKKIYDATLSTRIKPINFSQEIEPIFRNDLSKYIIPSHVRIIKHAIILSDVVFSPFLCKFYSSYSLKKNPSIFSLLKRFSFLLYPGNIIEKAIWIKDDWSNNYYHWLTDALPRLLLDESISKDYVVLIPEYYAHFTFIPESLKLLGFTPHFFNRKSSVYIKKLLLPSHTSITGHYNEQVINKVRNSLSIKASQKDISKRIYISRSLAEVRRIINEQEVISVFKRFNYEIHHFENYSLQEQIELMSQTKYLASIHGAGLTNMLFMTQHTHILEIRNKNNSRDNCFFNLASALSLKYFYIPAEQYSYRELKIDPELSPDIQDVSVSPLLLQKTLELLHHGI